MTGSSVSSVEEWRPVVGFEGAYEVSSLGRVRSLDRWVSTKGRPGSKRWTRGVTLRHCVSSNGYTQVGIGRKTRLVHSVVLAAFVGPCPPGMEVCHGPNGRGDSSLSNLRYDTHLANCADRKAAGNDVVGEKNGHAKLTEKDVLEIRRLAGNIEQDEIAKIYGIAQGHVSRIINRSRWAHV